ncbi:spermatogenesis-associated protein 16-like [Brachyhypopomus gauderio]|uniref:spermatogenesis-associated protein 16-like n=1 Tax=Brachyhypopomus gauderio TaxID=698409 RepID=UPI004041BC73
MENPNGGHDLERPAQITGPGPGTRQAADPSAVTPPPALRSRRSSKSKRRDRGETRPRLTSATGIRTDRTDRKSLLDAETKLVYGEEQDTAQQLRESLASPASPLKCQGGETVGPASAPTPPEIDEWLRAALQDADACYRRKKYALAAVRFTAALQLCSRGAVFGDLVSADYEDVTKAVSFIESRLAACYLRMKKPTTALQHSLRSIHLNPIHLRSHLQQAMVYRLLGKPCRAVRSAMIADYVHWLCRDGEAHISKLIKLYWQGLLEDAITMEDDFSVLYTPCFGKPTRCLVLHAEETFRTLHPAFTTYIFTDPHGGHVLPHSTDWSVSAQHYVLTLGFRRRQDGDFLDKLLHRKCPTFTGPHAPFVAPDCSSLPRMCETLERRILPVLDFISCTKLTVGLSAGSGLIERLQYADCLLQLGRSTLHTQELQHVLAELALAPYLQELSPTDTTQLQALMADTVDTLEDKRTDRGRVWNAMQTVGLIEDMIYKLEETYLKTKALKATRKQKASLRKSLKDAMVSPPKKRTTLPPSPHGASHPDPQPGTNPGGQGSEPLSTVLLSPPLTSCTPQPQR